MESGIRVFLLTAVLVALSGCATVRGWFHHGSKPAAASSPTAVTGAEEEQNAPPRVVEPEVARRQIKVPRIRSSNFELGAHYGVMSIEDFGSHPAYGFDFAYHMTEDLFIRAEAGRSTGGLTSFETLGGNIRLLTEAERRFTYYDLGLGYNFLPGEAFFGRSRAMTSSFYLFGGAGATQFAGDKKFTVAVGGGYQVLPTDRLAVHIGFEDHMFQTDLLGAEKLTNNLEAGFGIAVYF